MNRSIFALPVSVIALAACGAHTSAPPPPVVATPTPKPDVKTERITIKVGEQKKLPGWDVTGFKVADEARVHVTRNVEDGGSLQFIGLSTGETTIDVARGLEPRTRITVVVEEGVSTCKLLEMPELGMATIPANPSDSYSYNNSGSAGVTVSADQKRFVLEAKSPGVTSLLIMSGDGTDRCWSIVVKKTPVACASKVALAVGEKKLVDMPKSSELKFLGDKVATIGKAKQVSKSSWSVEMTAVQEGHGVLWSHDSAGSAQCTDVDVKR